MPPPSEASASVFYLLTNHAWAGDWQGGVQSATGSLVLCLPGITLAAGLDGRRYLRSPEVSVTSGARPVRMVFVAMAAAAAMPAIATLTLILTTFGINASVSHFHFPGVLPILLPFTFVAAFTAVGFLCGRFLSVVALVPVAAVAGFLVPVLLSATPDVRAGLLSPIDNVPSTPPLFLRSVTVLAQIGIGAAVVVVVIALLVLLDRQAGRREVRAAVSVAAFLAAVTAIMATVNPQRHVEVTDAAGPSSCRSTGSVQVCTWPDHSPLLTPTIAAAAALTDSLGSSWHGRPAGFVEYGLAQPQHWAGFATGTTYSGEQEMAYTLSSALVATLSCGTDGGLPALGPQVTDREQWLLVTAGYLPARYASGGVQSVLALRPAQQRAWWVDLPPDSVACR